MAQINLLHVADERRGNGFIIIYQCERGVSLPRVLEYAHGLPLYRASSSWGTRLADTRHLADVY
jgi:hypothetical protein